MTSLSRHLRRAARRPRILCLVVHYYGTTSAHAAGSSTSPGESRRAVVTRALEALRSLPHDIDVKICGAPGSSLLPIDVDLSAVGDPRHFTFASIENMVRLRANYDYFLCMEDDILVTPDVFERMLRFERDAEINEVLLPNRVEIAGSGYTYCMDLLDIPGWRGLTREFEGCRLGVALNPDSGVTLLSRRQLDYAIERVDLTRREMTVGGYQASALANLHEPFLLWRTRDDEAAHHVVHLDARTPSYLPRIELTASMTGRFPADALGFVDTIAVDGVICTVRGWASGGTETSTETCGVSLDHAPVVGARFERSPRPDVRAVHESAEDDCGFRAVFSLLDVPQGALSAETIGASIDGVELSAKWPEALALRAVHHAPEVPETPLMPTPLANRVQELLAGATCYLEYGTGGTTVLAAQLGVSLSYCVDSDPSWLSVVEHKVKKIAPSGRQILLHADIGPVGEWGYPTDQPPRVAAWDYALNVWRRLGADEVSPDVILVDGRFRVACFLASLLHARPETRIVFDDYLDRLFYRAVEAVVAPSAFHDRAAEFVVPDKVPREQAWSLLAQYAGDAR